MKQNVPVLLPWQYTAIKIWWVGLNLERLDSWSSMRKHGGVRRTIPTSPLSPASAPLFTVRGCLRPLQPPHPRSTLTHTWTAAPEPPSRSMSPEDGWGKRLTQAQEAGLRLFGVLGPHDLKMWAGRGVWSPGGHIHTGCEFLVSWGDQLKEGRNRALCKCESQRWLLTH